MNHLIEIATFIAKSLLHIWPYLVITIPLAVAVQMTGAAKFIKKVLSMHPLLAIVLATLVGAFSPFCSCGVIPVIATLLIAGVPLAPVMSFWIASPSMDPEIIFLSAATIGWKLTWWRLAATLIISLSAGFITHTIMKRKLIGEDILRTQKISPVKNGWELIKQIFGKKAEKVVKQKLALSTLTVRSSRNKRENMACCNTTVIETSCCSTENVKATNSCDCESECVSNMKEVSFLNKLFSETYKATWMVIKFMTLAFFLNALIILYVPADLITKVLGGDSSINIILAAIIGIPVYTSNLTALPLIGGLLTQGMNPAVALTFLITGPVTTLPAMAAVWGITNKKVFFLYLSFAFIGSLIFGFLGLIFL
ncbi:MAG: hypothetical protein A2W99_11635 [Bacteroidetes bacterium GWF2_33_16]|nr:MAG: hypothetical protein A2X00_02640 [Bacteroidetes bacterium GWE2_32_14]OFY06353.1 MAG: hypothetical protein A2W99_11635 [Bacteroidetes bacterium GWF2_33_16]